MATTPPSSPLSPGKMSNSSPPINNGSSASSDATSSPGKTTTSSRNDSMGETEDHPPSTPEKEKNPPSLAENIHVSTPGRSPASAPNVMLYRSSFKNVLESTSSPANAHHPNVSLSSCFPSITSIKRKAERKWEEGRTGKRYRVLESKKADGFVSGKAKKNRMSSPPRTVRKTCSSSPASIRKPCSSPPASPVRSSPASPAKPSFLCGFSVKTPASSYSPAPFFSQTSLLQTSAVPPQTTALPSPAESETPNCLTAMWSNGWARAILVFAGSLSLEIGLLALITWITEVKILHQGNALWATILSGVLATYSNDSVRAGFQKMRKTLLKKEEEVEVGGRRVHDLRNRISPDVV